MPSGPKKIQAIQALRGVVALLVIAFHRIGSKLTFIQPDYKLFTFGDLGVYPFLCHSGLHTCCIAPKPNNRNANSASADASRQSFKRRYPVLRRLYHINLLPLSPLSHAVTSPLCPYLGGGIGNYAYAGNLLHRDVGEMGS